MYKLWKRQIHKYASDLGKELGEELRDEIDSLDLLTIEKIKVLRFKLLCKWMDKAPNDLVLEYLEEIGERLSAYLELLREKEDKLLDKKRKIEFRMYLRDRETLYSDSDSS